MPLAPVGFDLDMTLIDSQDAILGSFAGVAADTGVAIDPAAVRSRLGIKLQDELGHWFPPGEVDEAVRIYRVHYLRLLAPLTRLLPGAAEALTAVRAAGGRAVVITAKIEHSARLSLDSVGLVPDELIADAHGPEKAVVLKEIGAAVYVGDTPADMAAGHTAGTYAIGVTTGSFSAEDLLAAGATHILPSLTDFPMLYAELISRLLLRRRGLLRPSRALHRARVGQHVAHGLLRHEGVEDVRVQRHPARRVLARQVQVEDRHPERVLLRRQGLVG
jgi:phosphoglycolate phosphatase